MSAEKITSIELTESELKMAVGGGDAADQPLQHVCDDSALTDDCTSHGDVDR